MTRFSVFGSTRYQVSDVNGYYGVGDSGIMELDSYLQDYWMNFTYADKLAYGDYYIGEVGSGESYKLGVCTTDTSTTKDCTKVSSLSLIAGILRYGELFAAHSTDGIEYQELYTQYGDNAGYIPVWLMTAWSGGSAFWSIGSDNLGNSYDIGPSCYDLPENPTEQDYYDFCSYNKGGSFPTIYLKSTIKIVSGSGTKLDPYIIT